MVESLLAILLVTSSAKGSTLVYRWPPLPTCSTRLSRARPDDGSWPSQLDNPWRASHTPGALVEHAEGVQKRSLWDDPEYRWQRPVATLSRFRSLSISHTSPRSPPDHSFSLQAEELTLIDEYEHVLGYQVDFLANLLLPHRTMCHQKFELLVDDLVFIGHPVCADEGGRWKFKQEKPESGSRERDSRESKKSASPLKDGIDKHDAPPSSPGTSPPNEWLQCFHLVLVCDHPDPSSSGNLAKYFDIIYEQIAFMTTAILYQEQVMNDFVEQECDKLGSLKDACLSKGEPYTSFANQALELSSIATSMKTLFEAVKSSGIAYLNINNFSLELQLPPHLDTLLHNEDETEVDYIDAPDEDSPGWGPEMSFGWRLPTLAPWKSLLLLDEANDADPYMDLKGPFLSSEDRGIAEGLVKFLETASITLSLADMASLLDWDLEAQIYPIVRWLIYHRRAKIVDTIHAGLKTSFTIPAKFDATQDLTTEFAKDFTHPAIPPFPRILAVISSSMSKQSENHFFASVVKSKELIPIFHDVVLWLLKRDLLITLHLRIRIVATPDLKLRAQLHREKALARKKSRQRGRRRRDSRHDDLDPQELGGLTGFPNSSLPWLSLSPKMKNRRLPSSDSDQSGISELVIEEDDEGEYYQEDDSDEDEGNLASDFNDDVNDSSSGDDGDMMYPSIISDPARATAKQRRWILTMSEGKDPFIAKRFELINQYFDGKRSDDEILYRAEISRKQLREVLHHYEEFLQTFLHPS